MKEALVTENWKRNFHLSHSFLSPHSLRHYAITNFVRKNNGNILLASKFARHTEVSTTMIYIHSEKNELYSGIERVKNERLMKRIRGMQEKI